MNKILGNFFDGFFLINSAVMFATYSPSGTTNNFSLVNHVFQANWVRGQVQRFLGWLMKVQSARPKLTKQGYTSSWRMGI